MKKTDINVLGTNVPQNPEVCGCGCEVYTEVLEGALSEGVTASVAIKVLLGGQFQLPENSQPISAIYCISSSVVFPKKVAVNIQHCAVIRSEEECCKLKFVTARCSQKELPYIFSEREGLFNPNTQYATCTIQLEAQSILIGTTAPANTEICCTALMFYQEHIPRTLNAVDFHFMVVKNLQAYLEVFACCFHV